MSLLGGTTTNFFSSVDPLDVDGDINFTGTLYQNGITFTTPAANSTSIVDTDNTTSITTNTETLIMKTNNIERMRIKGDGNVGIGKTNPTKKLDVVGDINLTGNLYQNGSNKLSLEMIGKDKQVKPKSLLSLNGDGITDDTTTINTAITYITSLGGGKIILPEGTFLISSQINITGSNIEIEGIGYNTRFKVIDSGNFNLFRITGDRVSLRNFSIDGNKVNQTQGHGLIFYGSYRPVVENLVIENIKEHSIIGDGLDTNSKSSVLTIEKCVIQNSGGMSIYLKQWSQDTIISNTFTQDAGSYGCKLEYCYGTKITNTHFFRNGNTNCYVIGGGRNTFESMTCDRSQQWGIILDNTIENVISKCLMFDNNQINSVYGGLSLRNTAINNVITDNIFYDEQGTKTQQYGIEVQNSCYKNTIKNNTCRDNITNDYSLGTTAITSNVIVDTTTTDGINEMFIDTFKVNGDINLTGTLFQNGITFTTPAANSTSIEDTDNTTSITTDNETLIFKTNNIERMRIGTTNGLMLGIGITNPSRHIHSYRNDFNIANTLRIENGDLNTDSHAELELKVAGTTGGNCKILYTTPSGTDWASGIDNNDLDTYKICAGSLLSTNNVFSINTSGNIGIGKTNPTKKLDVVGDINFTGTLYQNGTTFSSGGGGSEWDLNGTDLSYTNGKIGVGITNPTYELDVVGNMRMSNGLSNLSDFYIGDTKLRSTPSVFQFIATSKNLLFRPVSANNTAQVEFSTTGYTLFYDTSQVVKNKINTNGDSYFTGGNIGFGLTNPSYQIELATDSAAKPSSSTWTISSDIRLKENIEIANYNTCYDNVKLLDLKYYKWKDEYITQHNIKDSHRLGFIADDIESVFPKSVEIKDTEYEEEEIQIINGEEVIVKVKKNKYKNMITNGLLKTLNVESINSTLYGCVKKLIEKVENLETQNTSLISRISLLEAIHKI